MSHLIAINEKKRGRGTASRTVGSAKECLMRDTIKAPSEPDEMVRLHKATKHILEVSSVTQHDIREGRDPVLLLH